MPVLQDTEVKTMPGEEFTLLKLTKANIKNSPWQRGAGYDH
jgi:hypothetical protein